MPETIVVGATADGEGADGGAVDAANLGSDAVDSESGADVPSAQSIVNALHTTACQREVRCGKQATLADCLASTLAPLPPQKVAELGAGTVSYDARAGQALLDWLANLPCGNSYQVSTGAVATLGSLCTAAFRGTVATGGACQADDECAGGLVCGSVENTASNQPGCGPPLVLSDGQSCPREGGPTLVGPPCGAQSYCSVIVDPGLPVCAPLPTAVGEDCQMFENTGCGNGLVCMYVGSTVVGACGHLPGVGEACNGVSGCEDPTNYCASGTCAPLLGLGAACDLPTSGYPPTGYCAPTLRCDGTTCVPRSGLGGACGVCLGDLACNQTTKTCDFSSPPYPAPELPTCP
jgi:hypothetical protein